MTDVMRYDVVIKHKETGEELFECTSVGDESKLIRAIRDDKITVEVWQIDEQRTKKA